MTDYLLLAIAMLLTGGIGGILAGLLGIGGGIVIVPVMEAALTFLGVDEDIRMHVAVATSLATIIPTSIASSRAHHKRGAVDLDLVRRWTAFVFVGALAGTAIAARVDSSVLAGLFAIVALFVALRLILPLEGRTLAEAVPKGPLIPVIPAAIGAVSSMIGIGGGTLSVTALTLFKQPIHRAVGTSAVFGLAIGVPGTIGFMIAGLDDVRLPPGSIGYVSLIGFAFISPATFLTAPIGAAIAHRMSRQRLSVLFGVFLLIVSLRMFYRATLG